MPEKLDSCVQSVKGQKGVDSAWAICTDALKEINKKPYPPFDIVQPGEKEATGIYKPPSTDLDRLEREAVAIGGGLSAQSVGGKRHKDQKLSENMCECDTFNKLHEALMQEAEDDTEWITVRGAHIPIKKGENKDEVVKSFLAKQGEKKPSKPYTPADAHLFAPEHDMSEKDLVKGIKAGKKDFKDWYRNDSNEKFYAEIERRNKDVPKPKRPEGAGGTIFQDDPKAIEKYEKKITYLENQQDYWKKIIKFPARDYKNRNQLGDAKYYEMSNNSANLNTTKKQLAKVKERKESGTTLERKVTYKGGKPRFYYKENPKEGTSETIGSSPSFDNVLNALRKETR